MNTYLAQVQVSLLEAEKLKIALETIESVFQVDESSSVRDGKLMSEDSYGSEYVVRDANDVDAAAVKVWHALRRKQLNPKG